MKTSPFNKIILVDDDSDDRLMFKESTNESLPRLAVDLYDSPQKFLAQIKEIDGLKESLVFLDLNMPGMHGLDCLLAIRKIDGLDQLPVIIYSTSNNEHDIEKAYNRGANLYLTKPIGYKEIGDAVKKVVHLDWPRYIPKPKRSKFLVSVIPTDPAF